MKLRSIIGMFLMVSGIFLFIGCEKNIPGENEPMIENKIITPDFLDILDAKTLVVMDAGSKKSLLSNNNGNLFKIIENGKRVKVMFRDQNGQPFEKIVFYKNNGDSIINYPSIWVNAINHFGNDYLLIEGSFSYLNTIDTSNIQMITYNNLLVRKSDGAIFDFGGSVDWNRSSRYKNSILYTDNAGNLYYSDGASIYKVSTSVEGKVTKENILPYTQTFKYFMVDGKGNLIYQPDNYTDEGFKVKIAGGGIFDWMPPIDPPYTDANPSWGTSWVWVSDDGKLRALSETIIEPADEGEGNGEQEADITMSIREVAFSNLSSQFANKIDITNLFQDFFWYVEHNVAYRTSYQDNEEIIINGNVGTEPRTRIWGLDLNSIKYRSAIVPINEGEYYEGFIIDNSEYIYFAVSSKIIRFSKATFTYESYLPENEYEIFAFSVSDSEILTFNALRYSDAKIVLCEIDDKGNLTVLEEEMESTVTTLVQIN